MLVVAVRAVCAMRAVRAAPDALMDGLQACTQTGQVVVRVPAE